jgi:aspartyl-tRNA(Asn)/glutamyl-tRNA(Gln) amidotransferase subunit B
LFEICWSEGGDPIAIVETRGFEAGDRPHGHREGGRRHNRRQPRKGGAGKDEAALIGWFVGQVMKASGGKANPQTVNDLLKRKLGV